MSEGAQEVQEAQEQPVPTQTKIIKVYGEPIEVQYKTKKNDDGVEVLLMDQGGDRIALNPSQEILATQLFLHEYIEAVHPKDPSGGDAWLEGILNEIILKGCRDDPSVDLSKGCINFAAYLMRHAMQLRLNATKLPFVPKDRMGSKNEIDKKTKEAAQRKTDLATGKAYGAITMTITIKLTDLESSNNNLLGSTDCTNVEEFAKIPDSKIQELINKDDIWEALLMIVKQHRGKTCASANLLTESLNYDDNMTALLNPGNYFFDQYQRMHEIQKAMTALNNGVTL
jgi:hypothetical protein